GRRGGMGGGGGAVGGGPEAGSGAANAGASTSGRSWRAVAATAGFALVVSGAIVPLALTRSRAADEPAPAARRTHVAGAESHEAYLKGRFFLDQRSVKGWQRALEQFERAAALDPLDPAAQAALADTYSAMSDFGVASPGEMRPRALQASARALALDARSPEGLEARGRIEFLFDWNFEAAAKSLQQAIAIDPDLMPAYQALAWVESARGRHTVAAAAGRRALQLDPVNSARYTELAWVLVLGGRHDEALAEVDRGLELN